LTHVYIKTRILFVSTIVHISSTVCQHCSIDAMGTHVYTLCLAMNL